MKKITVNCSSSYEIIENTGKLNETGAYLKAACPKAKKLLIVTDTNVASLYLQALKNTLTCFDTFEFICESGEHSKQLFTIDGIYTALMQNEFSRSDIVLAFGGGIVGDIAGFSAATYMRGCNFVQIPTTLIAQTDSSVGGKTGVNYGNIKNMIGAFYQPKLVYIDTNFLLSLSKRHFCAGMAEVIKYACICNETFASELLNGNIDMQDIVMRCCDMKRQIVEADELDLGKRHILNFGHTIAHAIESHSNNAILHGEAVAIGMCVTAKIGEKLGLTKTGTFEHLVSLCEKYGLKTSYAHLNGCITYITGDKKRSGDTINEIFLTKVGDCTIQNIKISEFKELITWATL